MIDAPEPLSKQARERPESWWIEEGERKALELFHSAAEQIPAYKKFLKKHAVASTSVRTVEDFRKVPETNKKNYINAYPIDERSWGGSLNTASIIALSSGTTGTPTLWPRGIEQETEAAEIHEQLFQDLYDIDTHKTLAIIGFPMGVYVSGLATTIPTFLTTIKHPNLTLVAAGNNRESVLKPLFLLKEHYDQVLLIGHPFFIKDVIETAVEQGLKLNKIKLRAMFCSEGFSEVWRGYLSSLVRGSIPHRDFFNTYGSSEMLLMAYESPETVLIKKYCEENEDLRKKIFRGSYTPSLFQYNPTLRHIDINASGELVFTSASGIPLIRFNINDSGELLTKSHVDHALHEEGETLKELKKVGWERWNFPFVSLYGRSDYTLIFYAANIYPENIHLALDHKPFLSKITGKFRMEKSSLKNLDQRLDIHVELKDGKKSDKQLASAIQKRIIKTLESVNMEYLFLRNNLQKDLVPKIILHEYQDPEYFKPGLKPRYIG